MTRKQWKEKWRKYRVYKREKTKADMDLILYGRCAIMKTLDGEIRHIPMNEMTTEGMA